MSDKNDNKAKGRSQKQKTVRRSGNRFQVDMGEVLIKGEHVVAQAVIHDGIYWQSIAVLIFSVIVGLLFAVELGILLAVVALLMFAYATILKEILFLVLTNKRILFRYGVLQVDVVDIRFNKVESVELERMLTGYIMGYSNVVFMGTGNRYVVIPYVANGVEIRRAYNQMVLGDEDEEESDS